MQKGGNRKFVWKLCITFHIDVGIYLYGIEFVPYSLATNFVSHMPYIDLVICSSCHVVDWLYTVALWKQNSNNNIQMKLKIKFKRNSNNKIHSSNKI
jgi:hypothetical protein